MRLPRFIKKTCRKFLSISSSDDIYRNSYFNLLKQSVDTLALSNSCPSDSLSQKVSDRRFLPDTIERIKIVGFGTDDGWRKNGIWTAFKRLTNFHLFVVPDETYKDCSDEVTERNAKERDFLNFVAEQEEKSTVHMAFFAHSGRHISSSLLDELNRRGIWTVVMSMDDKHQFLYPCDANGMPHQLRVAAKADLYWTSWPLAVGIVNSLGGNGWFTPMGADPDIYRPITTARDLDVVFVGSCYGMRKEIVEKLQRYFKVEAFGPGWPNGPVSIQESIHLYNRAKVVLGIGGVGPSLAIQTLKGRDFEVPMCSAPAT